MAEYVKPGPHEFLWVYPDKPTEAEIRAAEALEKALAHDDRCESEWESGAMAYTPCGCAHRAGEA